jgi:hypothetical protein
VRRRRADTTGIGGTAAAGTSIMWACSIFRDTLGGYRLFSVLLFYSLPRQMSTYDQANSGPLWSVQLISLMATAYTYVELLSFRVSHPTDSIHVNSLPPSFRFTLNTFPTNAI